MPLDDALDELRSAVEGREGAGGGEVACTSSSGIEIRRVPVFGTAQPGHVGRIHYPASEGKPVICNTNHCTGYIDESKRPPSNSTDSSCAGREVWCRREVCGGSS